MSEKMVMVVVGVLALIFLVGLVVVAWQTPVGQVIVMFQLLGVLIGLAISFGPDAVRWLARLAQR